MDSSISPRLFVIEPDSIKLNAIKLLQIQEFLATSLRVLETIVLVIYVPLKMYQRPRRGSIASVIGNSQSTPLEHLFVLALSLAVAIASHFWLKRILIKKNFVKK